MNATAGRGGRRRRALPHPARVALLAAILMATARPAAASDHVEELVGIVGLGGLLVTDVAFTVRATVLFAEQDDPDAAAAWAEGILGSTQAVFFQTGTAVLAHDRHGEGAMIIAGPAMVTSAMTAHGIWSLTRPDEDPSVRFAGSTIIGINSVLTNLTLSNAFDGHVPVEALSIAQLFLTPPSIIWGSYGLATDPKFRTGWLGLTVWSSALFLHGAGAYIAEESDDWGGRTMPSVAIAPAVLGLEEDAPPAAGLQLGGRF